MSEAGNEGHAEIAARNIAAAKAEMKKPIVVAPAVDMTAAKADGKLDQSGLPCEVTAVLILAELVDALPPGGFMFRDPDREETLRARLRESTKILRAFYLIEE